MASKDDTLADRIANTLTTLESQLGLSTEQAAGVVGNLFVESGLKTSPVGDNGLAKGIAQWHPDRYAAMVQWAKDNGKDPNAYSTQLAYLIHDLQSSTFAPDLAALRNAPNAAQAALIFDYGTDNVRGYEGSARGAAGGESKRIMAANQIASGNTPTGLTLPSGLDLLGSAVKDTFTHPGQSAEQIGGAAVGAAKGVADAAMSVPKFLGWVKDEVTSETTWIRIGLAVLGLIVLVVAINKLSGGKVSDTIGSVASAAPMVAE